MMGPTTRLMCLTVCCCCPLLLGDGEKAVEESAENDAESTIVKALREKFPQLADVARKPKELAEKILTLKAERIDIGGRTVNVKNLAAEILEAVGEPKRARDLWLEVFGTAPEDEDKAAAMYALGLHYLLRERYADCQRYWEFVPTLMPDSEWSERVARYHPFVKMAAGLRAAKRAISRGEVAELPQVPDFEGSLGDFDAKSRDRFKGDIFKGEDFKGRWLVLDFWSSSSIGGEGYAGALRLDIDKARKNGWDGVVLGINVDTSREAFEKALEEWKVKKREGKADREVRAHDWPQHHDGRGYDSPIVRAFGIPRVPMRLVINPEGRLTYFTTAKGRISKALSTK